MNYEEIASAIEGYKEYLPEHFKDEKYKWEAVKHFQDNWDIEAEDFAKMLSEALSKTFNLLNSANHFPGKMIINFAQEEPETTRAMFRQLFDESIGLEERIKEFKKQSDECLIKWQKKNGKKDKSHFQDENSISVYLWLRFPDKYYIYKYSEIKKVSETFLSDHKIKKGYAEKNVIETYAMYDEIRSVLMDDDTLIQMLHSYLDDSCYSDDELRTFTIDFGFYVSRFYSSLSFEKAVETICNAVGSSNNYPYDNTSNDDKVTYLSEIIAALKEL